MGQGFGIGHQQKHVINLDIQGPHKKTEPATNGGKPLKRPVERALKKVTDEPELKHTRGNQRELKQRVQIKNRVQIARQRPPYWQKDQARNTHCKKGAIEVFAIARRKQKKCEMRQRNAQRDRENHFVPGNRSPDRRLQSRAGLAL